MFLEVRFELGTKEEDSRRNHRAQRAESGPGLLSHAGDKRSRWRTCVLGTQEKGEAQNGGSAPLYSATDW